MGKRSLLSSIVSVAFVSVIVFFVLYLFFPVSANQFFGVSIRDSEIRKSSEMVLESAKESGEYSDEDIEELEKFLNTRRARNFLVKMKDLTIDGANAVLDALEEM